LLEKSIIDEDELKAKMAEVRARFDVPKAAPTPVRKRTPR
jgi:hypothetical protein